MVSVATKLALTFDFRRQNTQNGFQLCANVVNFNSMRIKKGQHWIKIVKIPPFVKKVKNYTIKSITW